jgi:MinD superfamily P-loop ATPase
MEADTYQYSSKSTNLKQNKAIFTVIHDLASRVCERSLRGYLCCHVTSMEARRGKHFSCSSICQFTQWCALATHNRTIHRERTNIGHYCLLSCRRRRKSVLTAYPYCFTHCLRKHAHPLQTIHTTGEKSQKSHLMG